MKLVFSSIANCSIVSLYRPFEKQFGSVSEVKNNLKLWTQKFHLWKSSLRKYGLPEISICKNIINKTSEAIFMSKKIGE